MDLLTLPPKIYVYSPFTGSKMYNLACLHLNSGCRQTGRYEGGLEPKDCLYLGAETVEFHIMSLHCHK